MKKGILRHEGEQMSDEFKNSQEYRKAFEMVKKQENLYKNIVKEIKKQRTLSNLLKNEDSCQRKYIF